MPIQPITGEIKAQPLNDNFSYLDLKIDENLSGSPKGVYATLSELQAAYPNGADGIYVVSADGKWYFWNGTKWNAGGIYQGLQVPEHSVGYDELTPAVSGINTFTTVPIRENGIVIAIETRDGPSVVDKTILTRNGKGEVISTTRYVDNKQVKSTYNKDSNGNLISITREVLPNV